MTDREPALFDVWAPSAREVVLVVGGARVPMTARSDRAGWWTPAEPLRGSRRESDYGFEIDGRGPFPDPRSRRQPTGVHELSRSVDPARFAWTDAAWPGRQLAGSIVYELHIGTFTPKGTFDAAIAHLDHLISLGVGFVELLPVNAFNGVHNWGYDGVLWFAVHEPYGGPAGYSRFVDACHARGIGVIQDVVYNHLGPSGNYLPDFGPYLASDSANTWGSSVNLDGPGSDEVRRYILDNARMWLRDYHVDGLRLDAVHALADTRAVHILEELAVETEALSASVGRPLTLIAESDLNNPRLIERRAAGGFGLDAQWSDDFHHAVHVLLTGETAGYYADFAAPDALSKVLERGFFHDGTYSSFRGRHHGRPIRRDTTPASRLVAFSQDHDQIGNRAAGDRLSATLDDGRLAIAAALTLLGPFTPMLFMGEEWAASTPWQFFTSHPEPELGEAVARGRTAEFAAMGWDEGLVPDPQDPQTFERSVLRWGEREGGRHARILAFYRELAEVRAKHPGFIDPRFAQTAVETPAAGCAVVRRGDTTLGVNAGASPASMDVPPGQRLVISFGGVVLHDAHEHTGTRVSLGPHSVAAFAE